MAEQEQMYPTATKELAEHRKRLAPRPAEAFAAFSRSVFVDGALSVKTKQLIAVAVAHVTQCPYCIEVHTRAAKRAGASAAELAETSFIAAALRAGAAATHGAMAMKLYGDDAPPSA